MPLDAFFAKIVATIAWSVVGVLILFGSLWLFDRLDPTDFRKEIQDGNIAAGVILAAMIIAVSAIIVAILLTP